MKLLKSKSILSLIPCLTLGLTYSQAQTFTSDYGYAQSALDVVSPGSATALTPSSPGPSSTPSNIVNITAGNLTIDVPIAVGPAVSTQGSYGITATGTGTLTLNGALTTQSNTDVRITRSSGSSTVALGTDFNRSGAGTLSFAGNISNNLGILAQPNLITSTVLVTSSGNVTSSRTSGPAIPSGSGGLYVTSTTATSGPSVGTSYTGVFNFGSGNQIEGYIELQGGGINLNGLSNTLSGVQLNVTKPATPIAFIDFGSGTTVNSFLVNNVTGAWGVGASLHIMNFGLADTLRFGTSDTALTQNQLNAIFFNVNNQLLPATIDSQGYVSPIPEPSTYGFLAGVACFAGALLRRPRRQESLVGGSNSL